MKKVVLAYSGGLDTSVAIKWLQDKGFEVVTFTAKLGQMDEDLEKIKKKAEHLGAKAYVMDLRNEFVNDYIFSAIKANAVYEGDYPIGTALARPLIAKHLVDLAHKEGAEAVAHGCTHKGNDQVRFNITAKAMDERIKIIMPIAEWNISRSEEIEYAKKHGIPVSVTAGSPYSTDENLWCRSIECGPLEDPWIEPPNDVFEWTFNPKKWPDRAEYVEIGFKEGIPISLDAVKMSGIEIISKLNEIAGKHGIGRIDHMEDRVVGLKTREVYEAPAAVVLIKAHDDLEKMTSTIHENLFRKIVEEKWAYCAYAGLWCDPLREDLDAFINQLNKKVNGTVRLKLYKGAVTVVGRKSADALYDTKLSTYEKGSTFSGDSAQGFIELFGLPTIVANRKRR